MATLAEDSDLLSSILTYHVVPGQLTPAEVVGEQTTVQGETLGDMGSDDEYTVNGPTVICGGVQTANATVYLIDEVLMPQADESRGTHSARTARHSRLLGGGRSVGH